MLLLRKTLQDSTSTPVDPTRSGTVRLNLLFVLFVVASIALVYVYPMHVWFTLNYMYGSVALTKFLGYVLLHISYALFVFAFLRFICLRIFVESVETIPPFRTWVKTKDENQNESA